MELIINEMQFIRNIISVFLAFHPGLSRLLAVLLNNNTGVRNFMETREPLDQPKLHVFSLSLARARLLVLLKLKKRIFLEESRNSIFRCHICTFSRVAIAIDLYIVLSLVVEYLQSYMY